LLSFSAWVSTAPQGLLFVLLLLHLVGVIVIQISRQLVTLALRHHGVEQSRDQLAWQQVACGLVVLHVPLQKTTNGNLQAHYDQPHN
jgi:hypothetical protein